jgi:sulfonate transport system permease protein
VVGTLGGFALASSPGVRRFSSASVDALRTIPVVTLVPIALLIWGPSGTSELVVAAIAAVWPVLISAESGVRSVHPRLAEVASTLRLSRLATARKIALPAAAPELLVGARLALGFALVVCIVSEMVGNPAGLGYGLVAMQQALDPAGMWAYVVVIGVLGIVLNSLLVTLTRLAMPGRQRELGTAGP